MHSIFRLSVATIEKKYIPNLGFNVNIFNEHNNNTPPRTGCLYSKKNKWFQCCRLKSILAQIEEDK